MIRLISVALFCALASAPGLAEAAKQYKERRVDINAPMRFEVASNGGNMAGSEWISAEGVFTPDTPEQFIKFMVNQEAGRKYIHFNSPGGDLLSAIRLGEIIRKRGYWTSVNRTVFNRNNERPDDDEPGKCASACAYALLGGTTRVIPKESRVGVHQFYVASSLTDPQKTAFSALDLSAAQVLQGVILEYVVRMGVDPAFASIASTAGPTTMRWLSPEENISLRVDNSGFTDNGWSIQPYGKGAILTTKVEHSSVEPTQLTIFCRGSSHQPYLLMATPAIREWDKVNTEKIDNKYLSNAIKYISFSDKGSSPWQRDIPSTSIVSLRFDAERWLYLTISLTPSEFSEIRTARAFKFYTSVPGYLEGLLVGETTSPLTAPALDLVMRNCL